MKTRNFFIIWSFVFIGYIAGIVLGFIWIGPAINNGLGIQSGIVRFIISALTSFCLVAPAVGAIVGRLLVGIIIFWLIRLIKKGQ